MMFSQLLTYSAGILLLLLQAPHSNAAANGYHYDVPTPRTHTGHYFSPLSTAAPLPPVPALPPLPTARSNSRVQSQSVVVVHPPPSAPLFRATSRPTTQRPTPARNIANSYRPPSYELRAGFPNAPPGSPPAETQLYLLGGTTPKPPLLGLRYPSAPAAPSAPSGPSRRAPVVPAAPVQAVAQPVRVPFGQRPVISYPYSGPGNDVYVVNGRPLKQYAVIEFTDDNDISQDTRPFLTQDFFNSYRAQVGASGTGAIAPLPSSLQLETRASALVMEQQRLAQQGRSSSGRDTIALGSGGLGFIRLPNGSVSLGSGSLGFITGQQHMQELQEARTRSELVKDPLHFGHGPLGTPRNNFRFK